jgi:hypothetical protein
MEKSPKKLCEYCTGCLIQGYETVPNASSQLALLTDLAKQMSLHTESYCVHKLHAVQGRDAAQAVRHRFPSTAAQLRFLVGSYGMLGGNSGTGTGSLRVLPLLLPILIPPTASELYRPSDRRLSAKLVPRCRVVSATNPHGH